jgi:DNA-binding CsgD family transcriptional regulator
VAETHREFGVSGIDDAMECRIDMDEYARNALAQPSPTDERRFALGLDTLWSEMMQLKWFAATGFCSSTHCYLLLERRSAPVLTPAVVRGLNTLERVLTGESPKVLAYEMRVSTSTVASRCAIGMQTIGSETTASAAPTLFLLAAHAARGMKLRSALVRPIPGAENERWLVGYRRPDQELATSLTDAECGVIRLLVEGRSHSEMSRIRDRSPRTIANQLGSAFRKLGASGRTALVAELLRQQHSPLQVSRSVSKADGNPEQRLH